MEKTYLYARFGETCLVTLAGLRDAAEGTYATIEAKLDRWWLKGTSVVERREVLFAAKPAEGGEGAPDDGRLGAFTAAWWQTLPALIRHALAVYHLRSDHRLHQPERDNLPRLVCAPEVFARTHVQTEADFCAHLRMGCAFKLDSGNWGDDAGGLPMWFFVRWATERGLTNEELTARLKPWQGYEDWLARRSLPGAIGDWLEPKLFDDVMTEAGGWYAAHNYPHDLRRKDAGAFFLRPDDGWEAYDTYRAWLDGEYERYATQVASSWLDDANTAPSIIGDAVELLSHVPITPKSDENTIAWTAYAFEAVGRQDDALRVLRLGLASKPRHPLLRRQYGWALARAGQWTEAADAATDGLARSNGDEDYLALSEVVRRRVAPARTEGFRPRLDRGYGHAPETPDPLAELAALETLVKAQDFAAAHAKLAGLAGQDRLLPPPDRARLKKARDAVETWRALRR